MASVTCTASSARATLDAWRERGADRLDPIRFHFIEALDRRAAGHSGEARRILDDRSVQALLEAYAEDLDDDVARSRRARAGGARHRGISRSTRSRSAGRTARLHCRPCAGGRQTAPQRVMSRPSAPRGRNWRCSITSGKSGQGQYRETVAAVAEASAGQCRSAQLEQPRASVALADARVVARVSPAVPVVRRRLVVDGADERRRRFGERCASWRGRKEECSG